VVSAAGRRKIEPDAPLSLFPSRQVWTLALNSQITVPPAFDRERAYFGVAGDRLVCYRLLDGTQEWLVSAQALTQSAVGDVLIFTPEPGALVARRIADGSIAWELPLRDTLAVPPVWDVGWLVAATTEGSILAFRGTDGQLIWRHEIGSPAHAAPTLAADRVYVPTQDGRVVALHVETGEPAWEQRLGGEVNDVLALDDRVYAGSKDNFLYCLLTKNGRIDWRWRTGGDVIGLPAVDNHRVYFVSLDNVLRALDRISGAQQWMRPLSVRPVWGPLVAVDRLIVGGQSPSLQGYLLKDGTPAGTLDVNDELAAAPHLLDDSVAPIPTALIVTRQLATGAAARLVTRRLEPDSSTLEAPLPNVISMTAKTP